MPHQIYSILTIVLVMAFTSNLCPADQLDQILKSADIINYDSKTKNGKILSEQTRWFPKNKNFSMLFLQSNSDREKFINLWFDLPSGNYTLAKNSHETNNEIAISYREYKSVEKKIFSVRVLVPHPRFETSAKFQLLPEFAKLSPPKMPVKYTEDTKIGERQAKLYTLPDEITCQINMDLSRATLVVFQGACKDNEQLHKFASQFSFDRFEQKLNS